MCIFIALTFSRSVQVYLCCFNIRKVCFWTIVFLNKLGFVRSTVDYLHDFYLVFYLHVLIVVNFSGPFEFINVYYIFSSSTVEL